MASDERERGHLVRNKESHFNCDDKINIKKEGE